MHASPYSTAIHFQKYYPTSPQKPRADFASGNSDRNGKYDLIRRKIA
jgi:hypothetical protein